jgi:hypothetical protein
LDNEFNCDQLNEFRDKDNSNLTIKNGRQKLIKKTILVAAFVFILITVGNFVLVINMSNKAYQTMDAYVKLTVPNGYISTSVDNIGFLGGKSDYTISRTVGDKPVILENRVHSFGFLPQFMITRGQGGAGHVAGQWPTSYWEYGYNKMIFFHPDITYKEYKNDLININQISSDKVIELGLSLDKPYTISEISKILPGVNISWYWINAYRSQDIKEYEREAKEYDAKASFIPEYDILGVSQETDNFSSNFNDFLYNIKVSQNPKFLEVYNELNAKGYVDVSKVLILGVIVFGTKEELKSLIGNSHIKASSFGIIIDKY